MKTKSTEVKAGDLEKKPGRSVPELAALSVFLIALIVYFSFATEYFLGVENWINILSAVSVAGIIAVPGTMLLIAAQIQAGLDSIYPA